MSIRKHVSFMLYLFSSFDGIIINITTDILNESYSYYLIIIIRHVYATHFSGNASEGHVIPTMEGRHPA
jgi:hypothetical protein